MRVLGTLRRTARGLRENRWARAIAPPVAVALAGAAGALAVLGSVSGVQGEVGPGRVEVRAALASAGRTHIELPPLGSVSARSHTAPVALEAQVTRLDIDSLQRLIGSADPESALRRDMEEDLEDLGRRLALRAVAAGTIAGAVTGALLPRRRVRHLLAGAAGGSIAVLVLLGAAWRGFDEQAFLEPTFEGPIERAPAVVSAARRHVEGLAAVRDRIEVLTDQVGRLYRTATAAPSAGSGDEVRIVHVSDIHSNPLGVEVARRLVETFEAHAVVDTGDLTSFGIPLEARLGELVAEIPAPYYLVPGNHDSAANREALRAVPNVRLLDGEVVDIAGIRLLGVADPTYTANNEVSTGEANDVKLGQAHVVAAYARDRDPDVLAVHDERQASRVSGLVPLVIAGHRHERDAEVRDGTLFLSVGSTGATGLGSFTVDTDLPYEAEVLRFVGGRLVVIDYVRFRGISGSFTIDRRIVEPVGVPGSPLDIRLR